MRKKLSNLMHIAKSYGDNVILDDLSLYIRENEFITLLGPSGCGKTTTLRIIGGFETPDKGQVLFDGKDITALPPNERDLNTVFQRGEYNCRQQSDSSTGSDRGCSRGEHRGSCSCSIR